MCDCEAVDSINMSIIREKKKSCCVTAETNTVKEPEIIHNPMVRRFPRDGHVAPSGRVPAIMTYSSRA